MSGLEDPRWSDLLAGGYLGLLSLMWGGLVLGAPRWGAAWRVEPSAEAGPLPSLSICVPARDEAANIARCVRAALAVRWPGPLEVVVVDDRSSDGTGRLAREAGAGDGRLRVIEGTEPPAGWAGKPWACARASGEATGELLLFIDADVELHPEGPGALARALEAAGLSLISAFGSWELVSFWERAVIPAVGWLIRGAVDLGRVNDPARPEAFANGQFILARRADYERVGGHGAVRDQVLDDVRLAEAFKRRALPTGIRVAPWAFRVRLYRSLGEIVAGYGKNLYEGMGRRPAIGLGAVLFILVGTVVPAVAFPLAAGARALLGWGWPGWGWVAWLGAVVAAQLLFRYRVERHDGRDGRAAWTHPLANLVLVWILLRSVFGVRASWKGRVFHDGRAR